jgi:pyruvate kinase
MSDRVANWFIKTKIIATLGPASANREALTRLLDVGMDVCRLNFSHGDLAGHERTLELVRSMAAERDLPICVIGDLCGPKIRLGTIEGGAMPVARGAMLRMVGGKGACTADCVTVSYANLAQEVEPGQRVYVDDGLIRFVVREKRGSEVLCECVVGGTLKSRKGVNLPDTRLSTPALTEKDRGDLAWALAHELDYVALSFVREPEDLYTLKRLIKEAGHDTPVIIKIEKPEALEHLDELVAHTDAVLVARGDLGVETDVWRVPLVQKDLIARCQAVGVPVIVATQMLESMIENPMPTRAEVSDVANAIFDRADAVMLSGETAVGAYPAEAVEMMNRIASSTGEFLALHPTVAPVATIEERFRPTAAVAHAAVQAALDIDARLVAVWTATGATARLVARHRLPMPMVALTYDERVWRRMGLLFGAVPFRVDPMDNPVDMAWTLDTLVVEHGLAESGDLIVVVTSTQPTMPGATDTVLVHRVAGDEGGGG